jgi:hypothetical protein
MAETTDEPASPSAPAVSDVAEQIKREQRREMLVLGAAERVALALQLGRRDMAMYCRAYALTENEARKRMARVHRLGRAHSKCIEGLDESKP